MFFSILTYDSLLHYFNYVLNYYNLTQFRHGGLARVAQCTEAYRGPPGGRVTPFTRDASAQLRCFCSVLVGLPLHEHHDVHLHEQRERAVLQRAHPRGARR